MLAVMGDMAGFKLRFKGLQNQAQFPPGFAAGKKSKNLIIIIKL
jgi:hypothetical protein